MARLPILLILPSLLLGACGSGSDDDNPGDPDGGTVDGPGIDTPTPPPETTLTVSPAALTNQVPARFEFTADRDATFRCAVDDAAEAECTSPHDVSVDDGAHTFQVRAIGSDGAADQSPATHTWTTDTVSPLTTLTVVPPALDNSTTVQIEFVASEAATFTCALDGGVAAPCTSPHQLTSLIDGAHRFTVTARDAAGNVEAAAAAHDWMIDTGTPDTVIVAGPSGFVASLDASFTFSSPDAGPGERFECSLDGATFAACTSPRELTQLAMTSHSFAVRVIDATGNIDPTPAERTWTIDTITPTVTIDGPSTPTRDSTPSFTFTLTDAPTNVACRFDTALFAPCTSPVEPAAPLADGDHVLEIRVSDAANNTSTASRAFTVDTTPPVITIAASPAATRDRTPTFTFTVSGASTTQCAIGNQGFAACTSPYTPSSLNDGNYMLEIRATDTAGNIGSATRPIIIDTVRPTATILSGPAEGSLINYRTPTFTFSVGGDPSVILCRTSSMSLAPCDPTVPFLTTTNMADGNAQFDVYVRDAAGNEFWTIRSFRVDATPPTVWVVGPAVNGATVTTRTPSWTVGTDGGATEVACRIDNEPFGPCNSFTSYVAPTLADGPHTVGVRARDLAGNEAFTIEEFVVVGPTP